MSRSGGAGRVAVVGAGISGLVAAWRLTQAGATVTVFEADDRAGGKLRSARVGDSVVDVGAEAFVRRRPEVPALAAELGIERRIVVPTGRRPGVYSAAGILPFGGRTLMGIPADAPERPDPLNWDTAADASIGDLVRGRFGDEVVDRSVDPMVSGVFAANSDDVSIRAALPALAQRLDAGAPTLTGAVRDALGPPVEGPVFGTFEGGYRDLIDALCDRLGGALRPGTPVTEVTAEDAGWRLAGERFDAVVLAAPPGPAARVIGSVAPELAAALARIRAGDSALVSLRLPDGAALPEMSGVLIGGGSRRAGAPEAKAITLSGRKWAHLPDGAVRLSYGRLGDDRIVRRSDAELIATARADLRTVLGVAAEPDAAHVQRWNAGIPVYSPGHRDLVARIEASTPERMALAGAYFDGVGVPACIARAETAARSVLARLAG